ncbi:MAG: hypothetical protein AB1644_13330 [Candidatus Zixiibacteriota bacterium]
MIDFSSKELAKLFDRVAVPGAIFFCENFIFEDGTTKNKYLILLSIDSTTDIADYLLATSQVTKVRSISILTGECVFIPPGSTRCFTLETALVVKDLHTRSVSHLRNRFSHPSTYGRLEYVEMSPPDVLSRLFDAVRNSRFIAGEAKARILRSG